MPLSDHTNEQFELGTTPPTNEELAEIGRLEHSIALMDLFDKEVAAEDRLQEFLQITHRGSESRQEILDGPAYQGDEIKLEAARRKAKGKYEVGDIRLKALLEHAGFLGIEAELRDGQVVTSDPDEWEKLSLAHGQMRADLASKHRVNEREQYREVLQQKLRSIKGIEDSKSDDPVEEGVSVKIEERAILLTRAMNAMARRSMLSGLNVAIPDKRHNGPIYDRYDHATPRLDANSIGKRERLLQQAKKDFWQASGYLALRDSGLIPKRLANRQAKKMWDEFAGQFEHSLQQEKRIAHRIQLHKFIPPQRLPETSIRDL